jgi:hypothetical protein
MKTLNKYCKKYQDYSTRSARNPESYNLISFDPLILCHLTLKNDFWINRFSPKDRLFIPKIYLRCFSQITGTIYQDLCWTSNTEHIDNQHFHFHLVIFQNALNPYRVNNYLEILQNLWSFVLNLDDFIDFRGLDKVVPPEDPDTRSLIRKNYLDALDVHFHGSTCSFPQRVNLFTGDIVKNKTPYRFRNLTGMGQCKIDTYDRLSYGKAGLFYNTKDQDQLSYCDFSPALIKKARLSSRFFNTAE